jgi:uncharacterized protein involved in outer membrane biogenesis
MVRPDVWFETDPYGKVNWVLAGGAGPDLANAATGHAPKGSLLGALEIGGVDMTGGRVTYRDGVTGDITVVAVSSASVQGDGLRSPLRLSFAGDWNALPLALRGVVGPFHAIASDEGDASAIRLDVEAAGARLSVEGSVGDPRSGPGAKLRIAGKAAALDGVASMLGLPLPRATAVVLNADLSYRRQRLALEDIAFSIGKQSMTGALAVELAQPRPRFTLSLHSTEINLAGLAGGPAVTRVPAPAGELGLFETLAGSGLLTAVDGTADIKADTLRAGALALRDAEAQIKVEGGTLMVEPLRAESAGGALEGRFRIDGRSIPARINASVKAPALALGPLLQRLGTVQAFGGVAAFAANFATVAGTPERMLSELEGEALLAMGEGRVTLMPYRTPYDAPAAGVGGLVGLLAAEGRSDVAIECIASRMTVTRGVATSDGFVLLSEDARVKGEGTVDLGAGRFALRFIPEARNGALLVAQTMALGGSFHQPTLASAPDAASIGGMADRALYPLRRFFAGLAAEPANACLGSLPAPPRKRVPAHERPIAQRPQADVQQAGGPAAVPQPAPLGGPAAE